VWRFALPRRPCAYAYAYLAVPWAELETIDLKRLDDPAQRGALIASAKKGLIDDGFLFVTGTGVSTETLERQLAIAQLAVSGIPLEDKLPFAAKLDQGSYRGYKLRGIWKKEGDVPDNIEVRSRLLASEPGPLEKPKD
jgi:isopenicillin N synthase-like dioxygenase